MVGIGCRKHYPHPLGQQARELHAGKFRHFDIEVDKLYTVRLHKLKGFLGAVHFGGKVQKGRTVNIRAYKGGCQWLVVDNKGFYYIAHRGIRRVAL